MPFTSVFRRVFEELGLVALLTSPLDIKVLCLQRFVRLFAYGASTLVLITYFHDLGFSEDKIGLFQTLTLVFDVFVSWIITLFADGVGRRATLALGAVMMCGSGIAFALSSNYWILLAASIFGVITPIGNEIGPFRAVEESTISWITPKENRSDIFAWYTLLGTAGTALGTMTCGWVVNLVVSVHGWSPIQAYRGIYALYGILGAVKLLLTALLSRKCELEEKEEPAPQSSETAPLLGGANAEPRVPKKRFSILPSISKESIPIVVKLCLLFSLDSFGSGLVSLSWIVYFFKTKFALSSGTLGSIFFVTSIIAACSVLVASSIAKRFGNLKTMVFAHLPASIMLTLIPLPPTLPLSLTFLIVRSCMQSTDVAPRAAFIAAVLKPDERTAVNGFLNVMKTASAAGSSLITGVLVANGLFWVAFVTAGSLKVMYDLGMLAVFATTERDRAKQDLVDSIPDAPLSDDAATRAEGEAEPRN